MGIKEMKQEKSNMMTSMQGMIKEMTMKEVRRESKTKEMTSKVRMRHQYG
jgi:hypothetical protein